jgi:hypothetical protein
LDYHRKIILPLHICRGKGAEKSLHDDFVHICIHLTATSLSMHSCFALVDHSKKA